MKNAEIAKIAITNPCIAIAGAAPCAGRSVSQRIRKREHAGGDNGQRCDEVCFTGTGREYRHNHRGGRERADRAPPGVLGGRPGGGDGCLRL